MNSTFLLRNSLYTLYTSSTLAPPLAFPTVPRRHISDQQIHVREHPWPHLQRRERTRNIPSDHGHGERGRFQGALATPVPCE